MGRRARETTRRNPQKTLVHGVVSHGRAGAAPRRPSSPRDRPAGYGFGHSPWPSTTVQPHSPISATVGAASTQPRNAWICGASVRAMIAEPRQIASPELVIATCSSTPHAGIPKPFAFHAPPGTVCRSK